MSSIADRTHDWSGEAAAARRRRRYAADRRLRIYGMSAIGIAILLLGILVTTLVFTGYRGFIQTTISLPVTFDAELVDARSPTEGNYREILSRSIEQLFPGLEGPALRRAGQILTNNAQFLLRSAVYDDPTLVGRTVDVAIPASDPYDQLNKGIIDRDLPENRRRLNDEQISLFEQLEEDGRVETRFNWGLFFNADSRFPELAGLAGAIVGSFFALLVCFLISVPMGVGAAVYLEEFAPKNRWTELVEVNINNLAAVPSIVFGLLGLAVFLGWFGMPRSAPLVGGLVLSLMTLPTIIIVTRASLKAVPPSIREAALGVGASRHEVIMHHVLPLALPGILTGTIIGLAQALGETAPLLLIGMNAFITSPPGGLLSSSTALPTQIFIWADSPERGFVALTSAGILVLLGFLIVMNGIAIFLRQRLEKSW
ncbi:phosphate ABC transporter permease PstA [Lutibaculum baratangense]|uniref:Phosphate transport system permease protein PstA n=1 Tax=Lutibaculum baratangense AMV1 TaxID=631454 RepID=V4R5N2_9HYPH|nr:phosphate ABC transporter permease PstA [Lutibaculum baratangense]ESR27252.1 Phosphate transport system permease protein PstA [Lutibaculum baratangense AMV1]